jgi:peptidoglycan/xylan/chitin deacetylase (PgdA/CDA1 family)
MRTPGVKTVRMTARWLRSRLSGRAIILGYHRIADVESDPQGMCVSRNNFQEQLEVLRRLAHPVSLPMLVRGLREGNRSPRAVAITFDDGYVDVLEHARPLLEQHQVPASVFVTAGYLGSPFPWDAGASPAGPYGEARALLGDEVRQLAQHPLIEIGAHSVSHPALARSSIAEQEREICESKTILETLVGKLVIGFSYPHGSASVVTRQIVRQAGYEYACTSYNDAVRSTSDRLCLPRFWPGDWDGPRFERWLKRWIGS